MLILMLQHVSSRVSGFPLASPCLWGEAANLSLLKVSNQVVMLFYLPGLALRDIETCFVTCRESFCVAAAILWRRFQTMSSSFSGRRSTTLHTLHSTLQTLRSTLHTLHFTPHTPHFTLYTLHSALYTPHFTHCTLHSTLYTLHSTLHTLHFTLRTLHSTLYTLHSTLYTPQATLYSSRFTFGNSTLHILHFTSHMCTLGRGGLTLLQCCASMALYCCKHEVVCRCCCSLMFEGCCSVAGFHISMIWKDFGCAQLQEVAQHSQFMTKTCADFACTRVVLIQA